MKYRILGKTKLRVSVIGMGTWQFGGEWGKEFEQSEVTAMIGRAMELGINLIDTAECYGDHTSERFIGQALRELGAGAREKFILATKFGHHFAGPFMRTEPRTGPDVQGQLEDSLRALQTDCIDLYQYHSWGNDQFASEEVREVLEKAKAAGKIRHIGNSLGNAIKDTFQLEKSKRFGVEVAQVLYNRLVSDAADRFFPICERLKIGVLARVPLASGFLSGKYKPGTTFPESEVRGKWQAKDADMRLTEVQRIAIKEVPPGVPMARWALAWCLKSPAVQCVIPGCKNVQQVEENAAAADLDLVSPKHPWKAKQ